MRWTMNEDYLTPAGYGEAEFVEKRSRFIGRVWPVDTEAEALEHLKEIRARHWDATHNVYAYILREGGTMRYSDDGEPHGTAGMPVLDAIRKAGVTDCAVVVTRYFGGVLLGMGGLVRAYTAAASGALEQAGIARVSLYAVMTMTMNYADYRRVTPVITAHGARIAGSGFADGVSLTVMTPSEFSERFVSAVIDASNGRVIPRRIGEKYDFCE